MKHTLIDLIGAVQTRLASRKINWLMSLAVMLFAGTASTVASAQSITLIPAANGTAGGGRGLLLGTEKSR